MALYVSLCLQQNAETEALTSDELPKITARCELGSSAYVDQMRLRWYAQAVAPARVDTPSLSKMLLT
jgi:hypothetical protein